MMLAGKTIIVTGGGRGIGEAIARGICAEGGNVVVGELRPGAGDEVSLTLGEHAVAVTGDVRDDAVQRRLVESAVERFGRVDGLVNNAGMNFVKPFVDTTDDDWETVVGTHLKASFFLTQKAVHAMIAQSPSGGSVVNISSVHAVLGYPGAGPYDAAKAGMVGLTRCLAVELAEHGIRVNALSPGSVDTVISQDIDSAGSSADAIREYWMSNIPQRRRIQPVEIADIAVFLLSDKSSSITGTNVMADAGMTAKLVSQEPKFL